MFLNGIIIIIPQIILGHLELDYHEHIPWYLLLIRPICQEIVATLERLPFVRGRSKHIWY